MFFDTETADFWEFQRPPTHESQPPLLQVAAVVETDEGRTVAALSAILQQHLWPGRGRVRITDRVREVHGITDDMVDRYGQPPQLVLNQLRRMAAAAGLHVAHNIEFDVGVLASVCQMLSEPPIPVTPYCTMRKFAERTGGKWPKLGVAYRVATGRELSGAHDAMVDVYGCRAVYRWLQTPAASAPPG